MIYEGLILDGRNRYRACEAAGFEPRFRAFVGDDPLAPSIAGACQNRSARSLVRACAILSARTA